MREKGRETGDEMARLNVGRKSGFIVRGGMKRRETVWFQFAYQANTMAASATAILSTVLNAAALELRPFTIVRSRFVWQSRSDQSAATEAFIGNIGMAIVSDQASAIGVTAVPTPATDLGSDLWFLIQQWIGRFVLVGTDVTTEHTFREIDSKAMRKVDIGQDMVIVKEAGIGESGVIISHVGRMLVKLH